MHPQIEMIDGHVRPDVPHLLLTRAPDFLDVVEVLLDRGSVGERFHNLDHARVGIGREEGEPIVFFLDDHHVNHSTDRLVRGQERLVGLGCRFAVGRTLDGLPALLVSGTFG